MAVLYDIKVTVEVNEQPVQEYDDTNDDQQEHISPGFLAPAQNEEDLVAGMPYLASNYIQATSGAPFAIQIIVPEIVKTRSDALDFRFYVDGVCVENKMMAMRPKHLILGTWKLRVKGVSKITKTGRILRPFMFNEIKRLDETLQSKPEITSVSDLGTISIKVFRMKVIKIRTVEMKYLERDFVNDVPDVRELGEKDLKGSSLTHSIGLGDKESDHVKNLLVRLRHIDGEDSPCAVFTFKYRSRRALQGLLLIPRTPSPAPPPPSGPLEARSEEELTVGELRELVMRPRAELAVNIKSEPGIDDEEQSKAERGVKRERDEDFDDVLASAPAKRAKK